jgi:hypothetical protein
MALAVILVACAPLPSGRAPGSAPQPTPTPAAGAPAMDFAGLVNRLRADGVAVEPVGAVSQPFFSVAGRLVTLNGADVQVFEYATVSDARSEAAQIGPGGGAIGTHLVSWIVTPHFYTTGRLIVLYVGDDQGVLEVLRTVLDDPLGADQAPGLDGARPAASGESALDFDRLAECLHAAGGAVELVPDEEITQPFFAVPGRRVRLNGHDLQIFVCASAADAQADAAQIAPDGSQIGTSLVSWVAAPHFFQAQNVIVLYVGDAAAALAVLESALGAQIAGGEVPAPPG